MELITSSYLQDRDFKNFKISNLTEKTMNVPKRIIVKIIDINFKIVDMFWLFMNTFGI